VLHERDLLLGPDESKARALVASIRQQLVEAYLRLWPVLVATEIAAYGEDSYFGGRRSREDGDASSSGLSSPPSSDGHATAEEAASGEEDVNMLR